MNRRELRERLSHVLLHVRLIEEEVRSLLEFAEVGPEVPGEEATVREYPKPTEYPFHEPDGIREWRSRITARRESRDIGPLQLYEDTTGLLLDNIMLSARLFNAVTSSNSQITLKSQCPQCGRHLVLQVDETKREIYLACLDQTKSTCKNRKWKLTNY